MELRCGVCRVRARTVMMWFVVVSVLLAFLIVGCAKEQASVVVGRRDISQYISLDGETAVPAAARADIVSPYQAPVENIYVTVGQKVAEGDVIMELSAPQSEARFQQARQQVDQAEQALGRAKASYQADLNEAKHELALARETERKARQQVQTQQPSGTSGAQVPLTQRPTPDLATAIQHRKQAEQNVLNAQTMMDEGLVPYQRQLATAQQNLEQVQGGLEVASIRTPITGTVLSVNAEIGKIASPDQKTPLAVVVNLDAVKVYAGLSKDELARVDRGDPAIVTLTSLPKTRFYGELQQAYTGRAKLLSGEQFVAVVSFRNNQGIAKPGMEAIARVQTARADDVLAVPNDAIYMIGRKPAVKVKEGNEWRGKIIKTGISDGRYTEVKTGLKEGDRVLVNP